MFFTDKSLLKFTERSLNMAKQKAEVWKQLKVRESAIASRFLDYVGVSESSVDPSLLCYHQHCYTKLTLQARIDSASKRNEDTAGCSHFSDSGVTLRSSSLMSSAPKKIKNK